MIAKEIGLSSGSAVELHFSCGSCMKGHRASKCSHYEACTANVKKTDPSKNFYLLKPRGKKPSRTVALLMLQVAPTEYKLSPDWKNCPTCPTSPDTYSFQCRKRCCVETGVFVVDPYIPLQVCHTELDMRVLAGEDAIPYCGSEEARKAYRTWNYTINGDQNLEELQKLYSIDTEASFGQGIARRVLKKYNFDAYKFTSGMTKKTTTGFYKKIQGSKNKSSPRKPKAQSDQRNVQSSITMAQPVTRKVPNSQIPDRRRRVTGRQDFFMKPEHSPKYIHLQINRPSHSDVDTNRGTSLNVIQPLKRVAPARTRAQYFEMSEPMWKSESSSASDDKKGLYDSDTYSR